MVISLKIFLPSPISKTNEELSVVPSAQAYQLICSLSKIIAVHLEPHCLPVLSFPSMEGGAVAHYSRLTLPLGALRRRHEPEVRHCVNISLWSRIQQTENDSLLRRVNEDIVFAAKRL